MRLSVRARLTLTSCALIALSLLVFAAAVRISVERILVGALERALVAQANGIAGDIAQSPPGPPPDPEGPRDRPPGRPRRPDNPFAPNGGPRRGPQNDQGPHQPPPDLPPGALLPARDIAPDGRVVRPFDAPLWSERGFAHARDGQPGFDREQRDGQPILVYSTPVAGNHVVQTAVSLAATEVALRGVTVALALLLPVLVALAAVLGAAIAERALRPVRALTDAAAQIEASRLDQRLPVTSSDEFGKLAAMLNGMLGRLEAAFIRQRQFTADASHELRTPLAVIKSSAELIQEHDETLTREERRETLAAIDNAADRAARLVRDLLTLARGERGSLPIQSATIALEPHLSATVRQVRAAQPGPVADVRIAVSPADLTLSTDPDLLTRLVGNLVENALRHTPPDGAVTVSATHSAAGVTLSVADNGEGIAPEHLARLGEAFYRVDAARSRDRGGSGLGLSICKAIAAALGGTLTIESQPGKGTTVTVSLQQ